MTTALEMLIDLSDLAESLQEIVSSISLRGKRKKKQAVDVDICAILLRLCLAGPVSPNCGVHNWAMSGRAVRSSRSRDEASTVTD